VIAYHNEIGCSPGWDENGIQIFAFLHRENEAHHDGSCYHYTIDYHPADILAQVDPRETPFDS